MSVRIITGDCRACTREEAIEIAKSVDAYTDYYGREIFSDETLMSFVDAARGVKS